MSPSQKTNQYGAGVFYRKYKSISKAFHLFGEANLNYSHSLRVQESLQNMSNSYETTTNGASLVLMPGLSYSLSNRVQIELLLPNLIGVGYNHERTEYRDANPPNVEKSLFSVSTNLDGNLLSNFGIGFKFVLGK